jgi:hypothetical protein
MGCSGDRGHVHSNDKTYVWSPVFPLFAPFSNSSKTVATVHRRDNGGVKQATKMASGGGDVIAHLNLDRTQILRTVD